MAFKGLIKRSKLWYNSIYEDYFLKLRICDYYFRKEKPPVEFFAGHSKAISGQFYSCIILATK